MRCRSAAPSSRLSCATRPVIQSRMLPVLRLRMARSSGVPPAPKSCSNATRGSRIMGSGSVGDAQLIESVYMHEYPYAQPPARSSGSMHSCMLGIGVACPKRCAYI